MSKVAKPLTECYKGRFDSVGTCTYLPEYRSAWYFSRKELEINSPSRVDGIDWKMENNLRLSYCSFIQKLGMELNVPQLTIATAILFCHRFYMRQSHAKNDWQTIATSCMFLAAKVEETPCFLDKVVFLAYRLIHTKDPVSAHRIQSKEVFAKQKELIWIGERLVLSTIAYDLNIQHPYKPLMLTMKKYNMPREVMKVAWNFVNDWLRTTLCLQYKPHYIAAGSLYLAVRLHNVQLTYEKGSVWWQEFDVAPRVLEEVIQQMMEMLGYKRVATSSIPTKTGAALPEKAAAVSKEVAMSSPESCIASQAGSSDCTSPVFIEPNRVGQQSGGQSSSCHDISFVNNVSTRENLGLMHPDGSSDRPCGVVDVGKEPRSNCISSQHNRLESFDWERIREQMKRRRWEREQGILIVAHDTGEDSLERELESGIETGIKPAERRRKIPRI